MPKVTAELFCTICFNDEETQDWTSLVACGHFFHDACIRRWVSPPPPKPGERKTKKPDWCPLCRVKIIRPLGSKNTSKENSRFRKLVFNSEVRLETSSSPARLSSALHSEHDIDNNGEGSSKGINSNRRNMMVIDDSDASEDEEGANLRQGNPSIHRPQAGVENEAILTESESDEENTRPAQRAQPRRRTGDARDATPPLRQSTIVSASTNNANSNQVQISENETLGEARATIAKKNLQITELKNELSLKSEELELSKQTNNNLIQELQVIEARLREKNLEISNEKEQINKLKEEKKGLSKTLRSEVERVGNLNSSNRKLLDEITLLKQEHTKLKSKYEELEESFNNTIDDLTTRLKEAEKSRDLSKNHFTRIHDLNKRNELKLDKKRQRILNLEAELLNYKEIEDLRRREKGKGRALDQDDNDDNIIYNHQDQEKRISHRDDNDGDDDDDPAFAIPRQRARSRQISNKSIEIDDTSLFLNDDVAKNEDFEESLLITQVPDSEGGHHYHQEIVDIEDDEEEDEDAFADLDVILSSSNKTLSMNKSNTNFGKQQVSILSRDPLKEWTNTEKIGKLTSKQDQYGSSSSSFSSTVKDGKKRNLTSTSISNNNNNSSSSRSISNPSEKWADLAIYGKNKNGKNTMAAPAGEKKKARTKF